jgi:parvulin-like peptidyl-prolyl isomerase
VRDVRASQIAPFDEVESEVRRGLRKELEAAALSDMTARAEALLASGESMETAANTLGFEWRVELAATRLTSQLPRPVLEAAFAMPQGQTDALRTVPVLGEGYALVQLARVNPGDVAALSGAEAQQLSYLRSGEQQRLSFDEFLLHQHNAADIVIR